MRKLSVIAWLSAAVLTACGGSNTLTGSAGTGGGTTTATVASVTVTSSTANISPDGSDSATITAVAKDANNNFVSGATVTFGTSAGGLAVTQATTDASGAATATLTGTGVATGTAITVTASTGGKSGTATVNVATTQQTITVTTSLPQIPSDSSKPAVITALVRGPSNQFLEGIPVTFTADSGGLTVTQGTTDANGAATASLSAAGDPTNRTINVTAATSTSTTNVSVDVTGTRLVLTGPPNLVSGATGTYTVALTDSGNAGIVNKSVTLTSSAGNTLSAATLTTGSTGQGTFTLKGTKSGADTLTASVLGLQAQQTVTVSAQNFSISPPADGAKINLGAIQPVTVTWVVSGTPQASKAISFSTTRGVLAATSAIGVSSTLSATTDSTGKATVFLSSPISGPAVVTASSTGVTAQATVDFIATTPATVSVQASPTTIPILGQSTVIAVVRDAQNNLVEGKTVDFTTVNDITGGTFTVASALTDVQGRAQTAYVASNTPSASNGVTIKATVDSTAISATTKLTVGGQTVTLSLGTGNKIGENDAKTQFIVPYIVTAVDSAGHTLANVPITVTIHSVLYAKGGYIAGGSGWIQTGTPTPPPGTLTAVTVCPNEDGSLDGLLNGILDSGEDGPPGLGGIFNPLGNGNGTLEPGDVAATTPGSVTTDSTGSANFSVVYPEDHAQWVVSKLTASATVQGTESSTSTTFTLPILGDYITDTAHSPPGYRSPYGIATVCTNPN